MSIPPETREAIVRRSISEKWRKPLRLRLEAAESELKGILGEIRRIARDLAALNERATRTQISISVMLGELRQSDDTTIRMPIISDGPGPSPPA